MYETIRSTLHALRRGWVIGVVMLMCLTACNNRPSTGGSGGNNDGNNGGNNGGNTDGNELTSDPLSFDGVLTGEVIESNSTRESADEGSSAQAAPLSFDFSTTTLRFYDLAGNPLVDENGVVIPDAQLAADGTFTVSGLPVGVDFTVCCDIGTDGTCDLNSCTNIPQNSTDGDGNTADVEVTPLSTLILAKLQEFINSKNIPLEDLPISPVALVSRVEEAYDHLYEETGIEDTVTLDEVDDLNVMEQAEFFDDSIPQAAQAGVLVVDGNLDLVQAQDVNEAALAAAKVFLLAGFPIAENPEGLDLTSLGEIDGVEIAALSELFPRNEDPFTDDFTEVDGDLETPAGQAVPTFDPTIYYYTLAEPDRNRNDEEGSEGNSKPHLPILNDHLLIQMAQLQLENRQISLQDLVEIVVSITDGLGARLTYFFPNPGFMGPPLNVFETSDGAGVALNLQEIFMQVGDLGLGGAMPDDIQQRENDLRVLLAEKLANTLEPSFDQLTGGFTLPVVTSAEALSEYIRNARAHVPHSRTGPATFFVVSDADPIRTEGGSAVTVDADVTENGVVNSVTYNATGEGKYYLSFTEGTQGHGIVGLLVRDLGRQLHGRRGPARLDMHDTTIFQPVDGQPFVDFISETGSFFPGINISVSRSEFVPMAPPPGGTMPPSGGTGPITTAESEDAPSQQIFVLATQPGPGAKPVRVDYDYSTGTATFSEGGRYLLQFGPDTQTDGTFILFNEQTGRPASQEDPSGFFMAPPPLPDGFEDIFNNVGDFGDLGDIDDLNDFVDDYYNGNLNVPGLPPPPPPPDGGTMPPPDGMMPPGDMMPPPPPDGGDVMPAEEGSFGGEVNMSGQILIALDSITDLPVDRQTFTNVFGIEVANPRYNPDGDPYYDDIDGDFVQDTDEPTFDHRPTLFNPTDWRSTDIPKYYRRSDDNGAVTFDTVDFMSDTPKTLDGVDLVARNYVARMNAYRFGRPNTAINLLTAFLPPEFFNGTYSLNGETLFNMYGAIAAVNLMFDQVQNVEAKIDFDGFGPGEAQVSLIDAHMFVAPIGDPFVLLYKGFQSLTVVVPPDDTTMTDGGSSTDAGTSDGGSATDGGDGLTTTDPSGSDE